MNSNACTCLGGNIMRYLSVCSGIEAATVAWSSLQWTPVAFAEVEPFPSAVLMHRLGASRPVYPLDPDETEKDRDRDERRRWIKAVDGLPDGGEITNYGDFRKIGDELYGKVDIVAGGTPCQSYSLAGLRKGLDDPRGKLGIEFVRLCYRTGAPFFLWENVPGVLSSGKGRDFAGILSGWTGRDVTVPRKGWRNSGIIEPSGDDSYGVCWRVLDSQYTRVDGYEKAVPQRRRRVFVVGYRGDWRPPAAVLLEPGGMPGDTAAGPDAGEGVARTLTSSPGGCSGKEQQHTFIGRDGTPLNPICMAHGQSNAEICQNGGGPTLTCNHEAPVICYENHPNDSRVTDHGDLSPTLTGRAGTGGGNLPLVARRSSVRRLLPVETERLQGFPDGWTGIPWRNKYKCGQCGKIYTDRRRSWADGDAASCPDCGEKDDLRHHTPDGPRYKAVGNSWAVNCARWIGRRIDKVNKILADQKERDGRR